MSSHKLSDLDGDDPANIQPKSNFNLSPLLSSSVPLSLSEILDTINGFGKLGGLSEEELNSFRQQVLSLGIDSSDPNHQNNQNSSDFNTATQNVQTALNMDSSTRSGVFKRRGIGTIDGMFYW